MLRYETPGAATSRVNEGARPQRAVVRGESFAAGAASNAPPRAAEPSRFGYLTRPERFA